MSFPWVAQTRAAWRHRSPSCRITRISSSDTTPPLMALVMGVSRYFVFGGVLVCTAPCRFAQGSLLIVINSRGPLLRLMKGFETRNYYWWGTQLNPLKQYKKLIRRYYVVLINLEKEITVWGHSGQHYDWKLYLPQRDSNLLSADGGWMGNSFTSSSVSCYRQARSPE